jgi:hypothetical protein
LGEENAWPISVEPIVWPFLETRLPSAWLAKATWPMPVMAYGYNTPQIRVRATNKTHAGRRMDFMLVP